MRAEKIRIQNGQEVELSKIILGTAEYGSTTPRELALQMMDKYFEAGGRTIDTAREYLDYIPFGASQSELTIAKWLRANGVRDQMTIITKGGCPETHRLSIRRVDPKCLENDLMTSLAILDIPYVDGFLVHKDDESVPVAEIMDGLHELVQAGYTRFIGASNWRVERINEANAYALKNGKTPFSLSEIYWNMAMPVPGCAGTPDNVIMNDEQYTGYLENKLPVLAYSSQAVGFFSKYLNGEALQQFRAQMLLTEGNKARAERCKAICDKYGVSPAAVCLAYISCNKVQGFPLFGSSKMQQFEESLQAFDLVISQEDIDFITGS